MTEATISAVAPRLVLDAMQRMGADSASLARQAGLHARVLDGNGARVPVAQMGRLWQLGSAELADPRLGLHVADQWRHGQLGLWDYLFDTAATLGESLTVGYRYIGIVNSAGGSDFTLTTEADGVSIRHQKAPGIDPDVGALISEFAVGLFVRHAEWVTGRPIAPLHVVFPAAARARRRELAVRFGPRIDFGADATAVTFAREDLGLRLPRADLGLAGILRDYAAGMAAQVTTTTWIDHFRQFLGSHLDDHDLSLPSAARRLAMSPRTLQRRLEHEGTTWRGELDAARRGHAARLAGDRVPSTAIAASLGYSDARALRRAVRRWNTSRASSQL